MEQIPSYHSASCNFFDITSYQWKSASVPNNLFQEPQRPNVLRMCKGCNDWVACFEAVRPKLSHTSYNQPHKPESHSAFHVKVYIFLAQNSEVNQQNKL